MSVIEKLDSVLALIEKARSRSNWVLRTTLNAAAADLLRDHGPAIRQAMIDAERLASESNHGDLTGLMDRLREEAGRACDFSWDCQVVPLSVARDALEGAALKASYWETFCAMAQAGTFHAGVLDDAKHMGAGVLEMAMKDAAIDKARATGEGEGNG